MRPIEIIVGGTGPYDPAANATEVDIPIIAGKRDAWIEKAGYGAFPYAKYELKDSGGWTMLEGDVGPDGTVWHVHAVGITYSAEETTYSNGFNIDQVVNALFGRVGWRQDPKGIVTIISPNNISNSTRYFEDFHALVNHNNVKETMEVEAPTDSEYNTHLENLQKACIMRALNGVFNEKEFFEQKLMFERVWSNSTEQEITNSDKFVGFRIRQARDLNFASQIDSVILYFNEDVTFNLYLFKEGNPQPIWSQEVDSVANTETIIQIPDLVLNYISGSVMGGSFFFGYFQNDLGSAKAIHPQSCKQLAKLFSLEPIESPRDGSNFIRQSIPVTSYTYGLNPLISSFRDHTQFIVKKAALFDELVGLMMSYKIMEEIIWTTKSNGTERILKNQVDNIGLQLELNGAAPISESPQITGLNKRIEREMARVKNEFYPKPKAQTVNLCH